MRYLGGGVLLWASWLAAIAVGATVGVGLPAWLHLEFVIPLFLVGEVVPSFANPALRRVILAAAPWRSWRFRLPLHLGIALAIAAGIAAGLPHARVSTRSARPLQPTTEAFDERLDRHPRRRCSAATCSAQRDRAHHRSRCRPTSNRPRPGRPGGVRRPGRHRCRHRLNRLGITQAVAPLAAVAAAVIAVLRTGSSNAAILIGMPTLWITTILLSH